MRYLLLSDIHGNLPALEAVLAHAEGQGFDRVLFLGDAVGYYPDGDAVVNQLRSLEAVGVMGNHDAWMLALDSVEGSGYIFDILGWQRSHLLEANRSYLADLPWRRRIDGFELVHGSPCDPFIYVDTLETAREAFACSEATWIFCGHTHLAGVYMALEGPTGLWVRYEPFTHEENEPMVGPKARMLVNPGSVGQPRDGVPLAGYGIWDEQKGLRSFRVPFDLEAVLSRVEAVGFPRRVYERLKSGH